MSKEQQAQSHLKKSEECLKTTMFKWSPDFDSAAFESKKAADIFRSLKKYDKSIQAYEQTSDNYLKTEVNGAYNAAKCQELISQCIKENTGLKTSKDVIKFETYAENAGKLYEEPAPDTAIHFLTRCVTGISNIISQAAFNQSPDMEYVTQLSRTSLSLLVMAANISKRDVTRGFETAKIYSDCVKILLRLFNISDDESHLSKVQEFQRQRNNVQASACVENNSDPAKFGNFASEMVLVALANDDFVQANRIWQGMTATGQIQAEITGLRSVDEQSLVGNAVRASRDHPIVNKLLQAWDEDDGPVVNNILKEQHFFKQFETEYVKLVKRMNNLPTGTGKFVEKMNNDLANKEQHSFENEEAGGGGNVSDESDDLC